MLLLIVSVGMLLFVLVFVLNIVFWWVPFFRICLPIPKKGK